MAKHQTQPKFTANRKVKKAVKKTTEKKSTPKPPEKKLIDGLYSHKFNCRILPDSGKAMELMMKNKNLKSFNKAINIALEEYNTLIFEIAKLKSEIFTLNTQSAFIENALTDFNNSFTKLTQLKFVKNVTLSKQCEECGDKDTDLSEYKGKMFCPFCLEYEIN